MTEDLNTIEKFQLQHMFLMVGKQQLSSFPRPDPQTSSYSIEDPSSSMASKEPTASGSSWQRARRLAPQ